MNIMDPIDLGEDASRNIAAGMRAMARADGEHPREEALIEDLESAFTGPTPIEPDLSVFNSPSLKEAFLKSVVLVAFADGRITDQETRLLRTYATQMDLGEPEVTRAISDVAQVLLNNLAGVKVYREQVVALGRAMGLDMFTIEKALKLSGLADLLDAMAAEAAREEMDIDRPVYEAAGVDPHHPILNGSGRVDAPIAVFGRDPGRTEVELGEPFIGKGGQLIRAGLHRAWKGNNPPDLRASIDVGRRIFWCNTVPFKPTGNKAWSVAVKRRFLPHIQRALVERWTGRDLITCGNVAYDWFRLADRSLKPTLAEFWARDDRYSASLEIQLAGKTIRLHPLPHPSPLNATWYPRFPTLLDARLQQLGVDGVSVYDPPQSSIEEAHNDLRVGAEFAAAFDHLSAHARDHAAPATVMALGSILAGLPVVALGLIAGVAGSELSGDGLGVALMLGTLMVGMMGLLVLTAGLFYGYNALTYALIRGEPAPLRMLWPGLSRTLSSTVASFIWVSVLGMAYSLCVLPGIPASAMLLFVWPAMVVDGLGPVQAMGRSVEVARDHFWPLCLYSAGLFGISWVVSSIPFLGLVLFTPMYVACTLVLYLRLTGRYPETTKPSDEPVQPVGA